VALGTAAQGVIFFPVAPEHCCGFTRTHDPRTSPKPQQEAARPGMLSVPGVTSSRNLCPLQSIQKGDRRCQSRDEDGWAELTCPFPLTFRQLSRSCFWSCSCELSQTWLDPAQAPSCWLRGCGAQVQDDLQVRPIKIVLTVPNGRLQKCEDFLGLIQFFAISFPALHTSSPPQSTAQL